HPPAPRLDDAPGRTAPRPLQQPPRDPLPGLRRGLPPRHLPPDHVRPARRQGHPGTRRRPPPGVRHLHRPELRPRAQPTLGPCPPRPRAHPRTLPPCRWGVLHDQDDDALGPPLDPARYDYEAAVLWNAHAGRLWQRFSTYLRREVAKRAGLSQRRFREHARVSF